MFAAHRIVSIYFLIQAVSAAAWWALLFVYPPSVKWFQPNAWPNETLLTYWLADFILIIMGSVLVSFATARQSAWSTIAVWGLTTACWYPTFVCLAISVRTGEAWIATAMMVSMSGVSLAMATIYGSIHQSPATIRVTPMSGGTAVIWTLAQTVIFWGAFLWVLPMAIVELERHFGWAAFQHDLQSMLSMMLFCFASCLGIGSGMSMALFGDGTPLPTATAPRLVLAGPYRWVRNPMAVAGVAQVIAVGWYLGSYSVIAYGLVGAVLWHFLVRPIEEADLRQRFSDGYESYYQSVGLWIPKFRKQS
ncbi:MAG: methyltransferase [Planctomycetota bacterium]